jgi:hypothetical protein
MADEVKACANDGVSCIVDTGYVDLGRSIDALRTIATRSGMLIVAGGGHHTRTVYPADTFQKSEEQIAEDFVRLATAERWGVIGEIGTGAAVPMDPDEAQGPPRRGQSPRPHRTLHHHPRVGRLRAVPSIIRVDPMIPVCRSTSGPSWRCWRRGMKRRCSEFSWRIRAACSRSRRSRHDSPSNPACARGAIHGRNAIATAALGGDVDRRWVLGMACKGEPLSPF